MLNETQLREKVRENLINNCGKAFSIFENYIDDKLIKGCGKVAINKFKYINIMQGRFDKFTTKEYKALNDAYDLFFKVLNEVVELRVNDIEYDTRLFFKNCDFFDDEEVNILFQCLKRYSNNGYTVCTSNDSIAIYTKNL